MTLAHKLRPRFGMRARLMFVALVTVSSPMLVVMGAGAFEYFYRLVVARELTDLGEEVADLIDDPTRLPDLAGLGRNRFVYIRILDPSGTPVVVTDPRFAERWSTVLAGFEIAGDIIFGPGGPPDLPAYEATLPVLVERPEIIEALAGRSSGLWRASQDAKILVYHRAQPLQSGGVAYLERVSFRGVRSLFDFRHQFFVMTCILFVFALGLGLWVGRRFVGPLLQIQRYISVYIETQRRPTTAPLALHRRDELGELSRDVAKLVDRLHERIEDTAHLAGELAHDLKNPIATVTASVELLEQQLEGGAPDQERLRRLAAAVSDATEHMGRSVDGLLRLARLEESLAASDRHPVDLAALVRQVLARYRAAPRRRSVELLEEVAEGIGAGDLRINGVEERLDDLLCNLIDNAMVFCRTTVRVGLRREGDQVLLWVSDDGPGVSAGNRDKIFSRFFTVRPAGAEAGSGVGLSVVHAIAVAHRGSLELAESGSKPGACFRVLLPAL